MRPRRWAAPLAAGLLVLCTAAAVGTTAPWAWASWLAMPALAQVRAWQRTPARPPAPEAWQQARLQLDEALAVVPGHGEVQEAMGYLYLSAALRPDQLPVVRLPYLRQAGEHLVRAVQARPMVPSAWANQALALHWRERWGEPLPADALWTAFDRATALGQREALVQQTLAEVALARWDQLGEVRQRAVQAMVAQATPEQRKALQALARRRGQEGLW
ncbi:MAG: hypothetical protein ACKOXQ_07815 [Hydrogenophaga sp.]